MKSQYLELQREYEVEFSRIEDAFLAEREERLKVFFLNKIEK